MISIDNIDQPEFRQIFSKVKSFNKMQSLVFEKLYKTEFNILIGAPTGSGKTAMSEFAVLRHFAKTPDLKIVYIAPLKALVKERINDWGKRFSYLNKKVIELTGDVTPDAFLINKSDIIVTTPEKWDGVTRFWEERKYVHSVGLVILDEVHLLGSERGATLEVIIARIHQMEESAKKRTRIIALSTYLANPKDVANWLHIKDSHIFNFSHQERPIPLKIEVEGFSEKAYCPRMATMNKPSYILIKAHSLLKPVLIFVSSRRQTRLTAIDLIAFSVNDSGMNKPFLKENEEKMNTIIEDIEDEHLKHCLSYGIGLHHAGLIEKDRKKVEELFVEQKIQILVATSTLAWGVNFPAHLVIVKGTEYFDHNTKRYVDMPVTDILQMIGRAGRPQFDTSGIAYIFALDSKMKFYRKFLHEPFPLESFLIHNLTDHVNAEISSGRAKKPVDCLKFLETTFLFQRLIKNPQYYFKVEKEIKNHNMFLMNVINNSLDILKNNKCIEVDSENLLSCTKLGKIAAKYYTSYLTVSLFYREIVGIQTPEKLIYYLSQANEFKDIPVRHNEEILNEDLNKVCPFKSIKYLDFKDSNAKTFILLQCYLSHIEMPITDYYIDLKLVLEQCKRISEALVEICLLKKCASNSLNAINLIQMLNQGYWIFEPIFDHIEHLSLEGCEILANYENIPKLREFLHEENKTINLNEKDFNIIKRFLSNIPDVDINISIVSINVETGEIDKSIEIKNAIDISVTVDISGDFYKEEPNSWFIIAVNEELDEVISWSKIRDRNNKHSISFASTKKDMSIYLMNEDYIGIDEVEKITFS